MRFFKGVIGELWIEICHIFTKLIVSFFGSWEFNAMQFIDHEIRVNILNNDKFTFLRATSSDGIFLEQPFNKKFKTLLSFWIWFLRFWLRLIKIMIHCWMIFESREYFSLWISPYWMFLKACSLCYFNSSCTDISFSKRIKNWR